MSEIVSWCAHVHIGKLASWQAGKLASWCAGKLVSWQAGGLASWLSALCVDFTSFHPTVSIFCTPFRQSVCLSSCLFVCLSRCHASFFLEACHLNVEKGWHSGRGPPLYDSAASWPSKYDSSSSSLPFPHLEALLVSFKREIPNAQHHPPKGTE